ncbi:10_t:CDS:2, partial [Dentiscutata heterogama]
QDLSSTQIYCGTQQDNMVSQEGTKYENVSVQVAKHGLKAMRLQERLKDDKQ